jgi:hypothetical protein
MRKYIMLAIAGYVWKKVQARYLNKGRSRG